MTSGDLQTVIDALQRLHGALDDWPEAQLHVATVLDLLVGWCSPDLAEVVRVALGGVIQ